MPAEQPAGEPFEKLTVTLGKAEFTRLGRAIALRRLPFFATSMLVAVPAVVVITSLIEGRIGEAVPLLVDAAKDRGLWLSMGAFTLLLVAYVYFVLPIMTWRRSRADKSISGPIVLSFHDNGVATLNHIGQAFYPWTIFSRVRRSGPLVQLWLGQVKAILVPLTGDNAEERAKALEARCKELLAAAKAGPTSHRH